MNYITELELDSIKEFINIGMGKAGKVLNAMLDSHIVLSVADVEILTEKDVDIILKEKNESKFSKVKMDFSGEIEGSTSMILSNSSALNLVQALTGDELETEDLDAIRIGTLSEIGNIVINSLMGMISNILKMNLKYSVPQHNENTFTEIYQNAITGTKVKNVLIKISTNFEVENLSIQGSIVIFLSLKSFDRLKDLIAVYIKGLQ